MKHLVIVFNLLSFLSGISAITLFSVAYVKYKRSVIKYYIFFIAALGMLLFEQSVSAYIIANNIYSRILNVVITVIAYISCSYIIYSLPMFINKLINKEQDHREKTLLLGLASVPLLSLLFKYILNSNSLVWVANAILFTCILYSLILLIKGFSKIENQNIKACIKSLIIFTVVMLPYMFLDTKTEYIPFLGKYFTYGLLSVPIFYLVWNGISIYWAIGYLKNHLPKSEDNECKKKTLIEFYEEYKITNREQDVLELLIKGYAYKDIAESLFISLSTVKTHIRKIYQKTEVKNKIELINLINTLDIRD